MWRFLIDEDVPRSTATVLRQAGYEAADVRDVGLRGHSDAEVFAYAQVGHYVLVTCDKGFMNIVQFPVGAHTGIVVLRVPDEVPPVKLNQILVSALTQLEGKSLIGCLVVVEVGRTRLRVPE